MNTTCAWHPVFSIDSFYCFRKMLNLTHFRLSFLQRGNILTWFFQFVIFNITILLPLLSDNLYQLLLVWNHYDYYLQFFQTTYSVFNGIVFFYFLLSY